MPSLITIKEAVKKAQKSRESKSHVAHVVVRIDGVAVSEVLSPSAVARTPVSESSGESSRHDIPLQVIRTPSSTSAVAKIKTRGIAITVTPNSITPESRAQIPEALAACLAIYKAHASWAWFRPSIVNAHLKSIEGANNALLAVLGDKNSTEEDKVAATLRLKSALARAEKDNMFVLEVNAESKNGIDCQTQFLHAIVCGFRAAYAPYTVMQPEVAATAAAAKVSEESKKLREQLGRLRESKAAAETRAQTAEIELKTKQKTVEGLQEEKSRLETALTKERETVAAKIKEAEEFKRSLELEQSKAIDEAKRVRAETVKQILDAERKVEEKQRQIATEQNKMRDAEAKIAAQASTITTLENAAREGRETSAELIKIQAALVKAQEDKKAVEDAKAQLFAQAKEKIEQWKEQKKRDDAEIKKLNGDIVSMLVVTKDYNKITDENTALRREVEESRRVIAEQAATLSTLDPSRIAVLEREHKALTQERTLLVARNEEQTKQIAEQKETISIYAAIIQSLMKFATKLYDSAQILLNGGIGIVGTRGYVRDELPNEWKAQQGKVSRLGLLGGSSLDARSVATEANAVSHPSHTPLNTGKVQKTV